MEKSHMTGMVRPFFQINPSMTMALVSIRGSNDNGSGPLRARTPCSQLRRVGLLSMRRIAGSWRRFGAPCQTHKALAQDAS
jgi:hypothetical protein